jgi:hypothetical protein
MDRGNCRIRRVDAAGIITTYAGNSRACDKSTGDGGPAIDAQLSGMYGMALDAAGNLYIWTNGIGVRKVDVNGTISTTLMGSANVAGKIVTDAEGNFVVVGFRKIYKINPKGSLTVVAGNGELSDYGDGGPATSAAIGDVWSVAVDLSGNIYIAEEYNNNPRLRKVDINGFITTIAGGNWLWGYSGDGGPATSAKFNIIDDVTVDAAGNLYLVDAKWENNTNQRIRKIDTNGIVSTVVGDGIYYKYTTPPNSPATRVGIDPQYIAIDAAGNLLISNYEWNTVLRVDVSKSAVQFNPNLVGTTSPAYRVVLSNTGNQHMDLGALNITGAFDFLSSEDPSYCSSTPEIGPGFSCALPITFTPTGAGPFTGTATVTDNSLNQPGTTQSVSLSGTGVNP